MKKLGHAVSLIIVLILFCGMIFGCATYNGDAQQDMSSVPSGNQFGSRAPLLYLKTDVGSINNSFYDMDAFVAADGRLWSVGQAVDADGNPSFQLICLLQKEDGTWETACVPLQLPSFPALGEYTLQHCALITGPEGQLYSIDACVLPSRSEYPGDVQYSYFLCEVTPDGQCGTPRTLQQPPGAVLLIDKTHRPQMVGGTLYLAASTGLWKIPASGSPQLLTYPENFFSPYALQCTADGKLLLIHPATSALEDAIQSFSTPENRFFACVVDPTDIHFDTPTLLHGGVFDLASNLCVGPDGSTWLWDAVGISRFDPLEGTAEPVCYWVDSGILADNVFWVQPMENETFLLVQQLEPSVPLTFCLLKKADAETLANRTVVTVALAGNDNNSIRQAIVAFNGAHDDIFVQLQDYTSLNTAENNYSGGEAALSMDILDQTVADILVLPPSLPFENYINKGLFVDMYPYLDADSTLSREDLVPCVLNTCSRGNTLPTLLPCYTISTLSGPSSLVGDTPGWTMADLQALLRQHHCDTPLTGWFLTRTNVLSALTSRSDLIDYQTGTCYFDNDDFVYMLELSAHYPASHSDVIDNMYNDPSKDRLARGDALLSTETLSSFYDLRGGLYLYDEPATYIGFPAEEGSCGAVLSSQIRVGITRYCTHPQAAWQFISTLLSPSVQRNMAQHIDYQYDGQPFIQSSSLPANQQVLDELAAQAQTEQTILPSSVSDNFFCQPDKTQELWTRPLTTQEVEALLYLTRTVDKEAQLESAISNILHEEAEYYYNGVRTAEEAAKIIQNRVQTYLDEQA